MKEKVLEITKALLVRDICFRFDCNLPVPCIWEDSQVEKLKLMGLCGERDLIPMKNSICAPVVDILPDLMAIRCFGLSNVSKVPIEKFDTITALRNYFVQQLDIELAKKMLDARCSECSLFPQKCYGGCLANR